MWYNKRGNIFFFYYTFNLHKNFSRPNFNLRRSKNPLLLLLLEGSLTYISGPAPAELTYYRKSPKKLLEKYLLTYKIKIQPQILTYNDQTENENFSKKFDGIYVFLLLLLLYLTYFWGPAPRALTYKRMGAR